MKEHSFDIISKEMADSTISRGKALKLSTSKMYLR
jgi:hypothetical protein